MQETGMNVRIYLIPVAIVSIVDTRLHLPTETLLKGIQEGIQLELYYEWLGQARHQMLVGFATLPRLSKQHLIVLRPL